MFKTIEKLRSRQVNKDMLLLSELLNYQGKHKVLYADFFDQVDLDYSLKSLTFIDVYLSKINQYFFEGIHRSQIDQQYQYPQFVEEITAIVVQIGAYVGETIREQDQSNQWYWIRSKKPQIVNPILLHANDTENMHFKTILTNGDQEYFPMNIVMDLIKCPQKKSKSVFDFAHDVLERNTMQE